LLVEFASSFMVFFSYTPQRYEIIDNLQLIIEKYFLFLQPRTINY